MTTRRFILTAVLGLLATGLGPAGLVSAQSGRLPVVASFSILADLVKQVGGDRVEVTTLVGPDGDAHTFQPSPSDASRLTAAKLVIVNGLGLEGWMDRLITASGTKAPVVVVSKGVKAIEAEEEHGPEKGAHHGHDLDPHAWQNVANVKHYVAAIRDALVKADPDGAAIYDANAARYQVALDQLDAEVRVAIAGIPASRRRIITTHDAFGYFAKAYGLQFIAPQGVSTEAEASAKDVARIIRQIRAQKIPAVFLENVSNPRLMERIARESGARIGDKVYSDALSEPGGPAGTYLDMMRHNLRAFREALTS